LVFAAIPEVAEVVSQQEAVRCRLAPEGSTHNLHW
jgi:hypothetical protein